MENLTNSALAERRLWPHFTPNERVMRVELGMREVSEAPVEPEIVYGSEEKAYAAWLYRKSGVDFRQFQHTELSDTATSLISPLDHGIAFAIGFVPMAALVMAAWWYFFGEGGSDLRVVSGVISGACALFMGAWVGIVSVIARTFKGLLNVAELGVTAVRAVRDEVKQVSPRALERLSASEMLTGSVWIALLPVLRVVLKRRFKLPFVGETIANGVSLVAKSVVPMKIPKDADAQVAALDKKDAERREKRATASEVAGAIEPVEPLSAELIARTDADWVSYLENKKPKVVKALRTVQRVFLIPMVGFSVVFFAIYVVFAAIFAQMLV